jgi:hypothetical protein
MEGSIAALQFPHSRTGGRWNVRTALHDGQTSVTDMQAWYRRRKFGLEVATRLQLKLTW